MRVNFKEHRNECPEQGEAITENVNNHNASFCSPELC